MSNAMTNVEMDDVLASIRRLVSEESAKDVIPEPVGESLLMLTPALRVPDGARDHDLPESSRDDDLSVIAVEPPAELAEVLTAAAAEASGADAPGETEPLAPSPEFDEMEKAWKAELARVAQARQNVAPDDLSGAAEAKVPASLEHQIAELEAAVGQATEEWEPDGSEPEAKQPLRRHIFEVVSNSSNSDAVEIEHDPEENVPVFSHAAVQRPKPYLLSEGVSRENAEDQSETVPHTEISEIVGEPAEIVENDDVFLDVEALRSMISDVVREELHGKLGETITRNVRRMIQQEITRAVADQTPDEDDLG